MKKLDKAEAPWITRCMAADVALFLGGLSVVEDVYLVGSIARGDLGRDLDVVTAVPEPVADAFIDEVWDLWRSEGLKAPEDVTAGWLPAVRWPAAQDVLGFTERDFAEIQEGWDRRLGHLDIIVLPTGWLARTSELQLRLPYDNPKFMDNLARDALIFGPESLAFVEPAPLSPQPLPK